VKYAEARGMSSTLSKGSPEVGNKYSRGILSYHLKATFTKDKMRDTASPLHATQENVSPVTNNFI
jgi:hypothetical protein